ncbi:chromosome segregation ATPase [Pseudoxanthomonas japonensis]|uniref:hypothetical protein n=1 Tax=Pseudoxanthomonas japonensis TaxID=69284 RepID=UPI00285CED91|nr:hypothetical protein [Pseudoxanthomonas japonensis]MDR7070604.1 chromosome segregation ATPase [Pseudoxanthomonas japonensis]
MDPTNFTTRQYIESFTAGTWTAVCTAIVALLGAGYWAGGTVAENGSAIRQGEQVGTINELRSQLGSARSEISRATQAVIESREAHKKTYLELEALRRENATLSAKVNRASNCTFIHAQIRALETQIQETKPFWFGNDRASAIAEEKERKAALQQRLEGYQHQLGTCNG